MIEILKGYTSRSEQFALIDSVSGLPKTNLLFSDVTASYVRTRSARVNIPTVTLASASVSYTSGGFIVIDSTNQPGLYRLDIPDAAFASGVDEVVVTVKATGCKVEHIKFILIDWNKQVTLNSSVWTGGTRELTSGQGIVLNKGTGILGFNDVSSTDVWAAANRTLSSGQNIVLNKGTGILGFNDVSVTDVWAQAPPSVSIQDMVTSFWSAENRTLTSGNGIVLAKGIGIIGLNDIQVTDVWSAVSRTLSSSQNIVLVKGIGITGFNDISAANVWANASRTLTDKTGFALGLDGLDAINNVLQSPGLPLNFRQKLLLLFEREFGHNEMDLVAKKLRTYHPDTGQILSSQDVDKSEELQFLGVSS